MSAIDRELLKQAVSKPKRLYSIFDRIELKKHSFNALRRSELKPEILTANGLASEFPVLTEDALLLDLDRLEQNLSKSAHEESLPYLFQKYGWHIAHPDGQEDFPDAALCDIARAEKALGNSDSNIGYLLVKGDLTGIQEYIYKNIQAGQVGGLGGLTRRLRARSILVSLLTDFVANVILRELGEPSWHLLFAGGGHFNLLIPAKPEYEVRLKMLSESLDKQMLHQFGDRLELIVAHEKVETRAELEKNAKHYFEKVNTKRDRQKFAQHRKDLHDLFERNIERIEVDEAEVGRLFPKMQYLVEVVSEKELKANYNKKDCLPLTAFSDRSFHTLLAVRNVQEAHQFLTKNTGNDIKHAFIFRLNDTDFMPDENWKDDFNFPVSFGFRFIGKNAPRQDEDDPDSDILDFEEIAKIGMENPKKGEGFLRLGSLMLDVDNLGMIFSHGIKGLTLPQIITLSREMNYFFSAHFDQRAKAKEHRVYVVYSGGDDAFAVGKWDLLIRFAKQLRKDFQKFTRFDENRNDDVHFSAGIFMSNPHYPVGRFYRDTKKAQDHAKEIKDSVEVFGYAMDWNSFDSKIDLGDTLFDPLKKGITCSGRKFSASFAYRVMQLVKTSFYERDEWDAISNKVIRQGGIRSQKFARNTALMRNLFARNGFSEAEIQKISDDIERQLILTFLKDTYSLDKSEEVQKQARDYLVALNFAMLQVRSSKK